MTRQGIPLQTVRRRGHFWDWGIRAGGGEEGEQCGHGWGDGGEGPEAWIMGEEQRGEGGGAPSCAL